LYILFSLVDDYEDIIPNSLRPSPEDIHRMVNFWEMQTQPLNEEFEFCPLLPLVEELGNGSLNVNCVCFIFECVREIKYVSSLMQAAIKMRFISNILEYLR
jgi:hypothetical protein